PICPAGAQWPPRRLEKGDWGSAIDATGCGGISLSGERGTAGSRSLVPRRIYDERVRRCGAQAANVQVGLPSAPRPEVGTTVHTGHFDKVWSYGQIGTEDARLVAGGERPEEFPAGNFLQPTVFADVSPGARIFQEEIVGPVVAITPFDTDEEALELANNTSYGLAAYVWTNDLKRSHNFAQNVDAGMVW